MRRPSPSAAARSMRAMNDCQLFDQHQWHATFQVGKYLCTSCGASFFCPVCTLGIPRNARTRLCPQHAAEQQERDAEIAARRQQQASPPPQRQQQDQKGDRS